MLFGGKKKQDTISFFIMVISGFNLGIAGILGTNIGMALSSNKIVFVFTGIVYIITAVYLKKRWKSSGKKLFKAETAHDSGRIS